MNERKLDVYLGERLVGTLAETADHRAAFAYADAWLEDGFAISPFSLRTACPTHGAACWWTAC